MKLNSRLADVFERSTWSSTTLPFRPSHRLRRGTSSAVRRSVQRRCWPLLPGFSPPPLEQLRTNRSGSGRLPKPARTATACSRQRSSSYRPISPTSTPATRAPLTSSITCSLVHNRRIRWIPARASGLLARSSDDAGREHEAPGGLGIRACAAPLLYSRKLRRDGLNPGHRGGC